jgi:glycosyltransferase involved in cell wall biosynthesis
MESVTVVIPALNEEASIPDVIRGVQLAAIRHVIVADGGSTDRTVACARAAGAVVIEPGQGYGRACLHAARAATTDVVVFMDGDGADDPACIAALIEPIGSGRYDFVIGSRVRGERAPGSMAWHQILAGELFGLAIRLRYGVRYTDMCAFRAIRRDALLALGMQEMTYGWNIEMQMLAAQAQLRILEIPVSYHCRTGGTSKVAGSLGGTIRAVKSIVSAFLRVASRSRSLGSATMDVRST